MDDNLIPMCNLVMAIAAGALGAIVSARTTWKLAISWGFDPVTCRTELEYFTLIAAIVSAITGALANVGTVQMCGEPYGLIELALSAPLFCFVWIAIALFSKVYERMLDGINSKM